MEKIENSLAGTAAVVVPGSVPLLPIRQMPPLGTDEIDQAGLTLMESWISELPP